MPEYTTIKQMIEAAASGGSSLARLVLEAEIAEQGADAESVKARLRSTLEVMRTAMEHGLAADRPSPSGLSGGMAMRMRTYVDNLAGNNLTGNLMGKAVARALATAEVNANMGRIAAAPTAGSAGILPAVLFTVGEKTEASEEQLMDALLVAAGYGQVIARWATIAGAAGGCQAECGSSAAMAAAAAVYLAGGTPEQGASAAAIALKSMMGLVCDPVAGLVEVPCIKRNATAVAIALSSADMALAGIDTAIPVDEVIQAMGQVGRAMPPSLKETSQGGIAVTPTAMAIAERLRTKESGDRSQETGGTPKA
jgi:L-serine dehydratase